MTHYTNMTQEQLVELLNLRDDKIKQLENEILELKRGYIYIMQFENDIKNHKQPILSKFNYNQRTHYRHIHIQQLYIQVLQRQCICANTFGTKLRTLIFVVRK